MDKLLDMEKHSRGWVEQNLYEPLVARSESLSQFNNLTCNLCLVVGIIEGLHVRYHILHYHLHIT